MHPPDTDPRISQLDLLRDLSADSLVKVLQKTREHNAKPGDRLFTQGVNDKSYIFLLEGEIELRENANTVKTIQSGTEEALEPLAHKHPREVSGFAVGPVKYISIESQTLDMLIAWENQANYDVREVSENPSSTEDDWLMRLLAKPVFNRASPRQLQTLFTHFDPLKVKSGDAVITQGSDADYLFILVSGKASVVHKTGNHPDGLKLAILNPGDTFGEDALISNKQRNATVTMLSDGMVVRIAADTFKLFLDTTPSEEVDYEEANQMVVSGIARWLDVRMPNEYKRDHIEGALNLPLILLRVKLDTELKQGETYVLYCDDGKRSAAGAFLLRQRGFHATVLKGGLASRVDRIESLYALDQTA